MIMQQTSTSLLESEVQDAIPRLEKLCPTNDSHALRMVSLNCRDQHSARAKSRNISGVRASPRIP